jgi:hypothetical protein
MSGLGKAAPSSSRFRFAQPGFLRHPEIRVKHSPIDRLILRTLDPSAAQQQKSTKSECIIQDREQQLW